MARYAATGSDASAIDRVIVPFFGGNRLLQDISVKDVAAFRLSRGQGRAVSTVNVDHNILKRIRSLDGVTRIQGLVFH